MDERSAPGPSASIPTTRGYQQEMLEESLRRNIIIALDTGSGKTHIAVIRMKIEVEQEPNKISWFVAPTVALCEQQKTVIQTTIPVSVGLVSGALEPDQWKNATLWEKVLETHRIMVTTPQVLLDALRHGYIVLGRDISLLVFDEAHHAVDNHPYNKIMMEFYFNLPRRQHPAVRTTSHPVVSSELVRPMVLGLTASPIFGGNPLKAFQTIEGNLDCMIRAPRRNRAELATFVHRPVFRHILYSPPDVMNPPFSTNLAALHAVMNSLNIENDPYVKSLRGQLSKAVRGTTEYRRLDQRLSKVILQKSSFTHKGLRDFARTADAICNDLGSWAADWYVWKVVERAKHASNPYNLIFTSWKSQEKAYLLAILEQIVISPVSHYPDDIVDDSSDKVQVLIDCLLCEKREAEAHNESYSGIIFVQRRDTVLALAEVLEHHPLTNNTFGIGCLLGTSDSAHRHSFLDITRTLLKDSQEDTLMDFKIGGKNLIISTAVAEEGIDIQACGSVIRWDPPPNMASWTQSRGRARRQRSTFTVMFERGGTHKNDVDKWEVLERGMVALYNDPSRDLIETPQESLDEEDSDLEFRIPSTGALLTLHSAVSHLSHFCAVIPNPSHVDNRPLYDTDPPEVPEGWHSSEPRSNHPIMLYNGPFGSTVTLPRSLPLPNRVFSTERIYSTRISAHRHVAFMAYRALYDAKLLNDNLLPITSVIEPHLEEEVKEMLRDVEKRAGTANVSLQMDPWAPEDGDTNWWSSELVIYGLPPLTLFTRSQHIILPDNKGPVLYRPGREPVQTFLRPLGKLAPTDDRLVQARHYTRRLFWSLNGARMVWDNLDFSYLVLPSNSADDAEWETRRAWSTQSNSQQIRAHEEEYLANAKLFGNDFGYPTDLSMIRNASGFARPFRFIRWRYEPLTSDEEADIRGLYSRSCELEITYPLLVVQPYPPRTNFLLPTSPCTELPSKSRSLCLIPALSTLALFSPADTEYAFLLPSFLRSLYMSLTAYSLRKTLFAASPLSHLSLPLLTMAITAPLSQEKFNYQRLETLGDTVLKFVVGIQLLAEYPLWHEGYLSRKKDHAVSNVRLAKEDIARGLYRWIIRDRMLGKKWKPSYLNARVYTTDPIKSGDDMVERDRNMSQRRSKKKQELSTKVLADVVESLIGAAYLQGGFDLGCECSKFFDLGLKWEPLPDRIQTLLSRVEDPVNIPSQITDVEGMIGYTFNRKLLLIEALTHASYEQNLHTPSYERMEFLGDSVLDMIVTDYLYHAPGKNYSPGHIFLRKAAMVNAHILAYICLRCSIGIDATMPRPNAQGVVLLEPDTQEVYLWQCLLHSSPRLLDDQTNTYARYRRRAPEIEDALQNGTMFPWAALTRLQAPKFFSDMVESLLGAVYIDSNGNLDASRNVMRTLGLFQILERIVQDNVDVLHPVSRLSTWTQKNNKKLEFVYVKEKGNIACIIIVDGKEEVRHTVLYRGHLSQEEARFVAAEEASKTLPLRHVSMNYSMTKRKRKTIEAPE